MRELFSFKGEIGRGMFWLIVIAVGLGGLAFDFVAYAAARYAGDPVIVFGENPDWPETALGWGLFILYWLIQIVLFWIYTTAWMKRLRDVGIALKWLAIFFAFAGGMMIVDKLVPDDVSISGWQVGALVVVMFPGCVVGAWLYGAALFLSGYKSAQVDLEKLPAGWKWS